MKTPTYPATATDYRRLVRARLPAFLFDYIDGGASDEHTLASNVSDWQQISLRQRVLIGRPWIWALAGAGETGVRELILSWQRELALAMTLAGVTRVTDIGQSHLDRVAPGASL